MHLVLSSINIISLNSNCMHCSAAEFNEIFSYTQ